jgi:protein gp37
MFTPSTGSRIEWTGRTWNPVTGCTEVSPGCDNCYARTFAERWRGTPGHPYERGFDVQLRHARLLQPLRWAGAQTVFVNSMSDLFHADVPEEFIAHVFAVMGLCGHTFQVLTKRHGRARALLNDPEFRQLVLDIAEATVEEVPAAANREVPRSWPLPNVWLGVSAETQQWADIRIPALLATPAAVRFVSAEPLLGPLDLSAWTRPQPGCFHTDSDGLCAHPLAGTPECHRGADCPVTPRYQGIDWVIVGGESGPGARPLDPTWVADLVTHCTVTGVPVFVKQLGAVWARESGAGRGKGNDPLRWPADLRVRQFPTPGADDDHNLQTTAECLRWLNSGRQHPVIGRSVT